MLTVGEVADRIGAKPFDVTTLLYHRVVDITRCPLERRRRRIPLDMVPTIAEALRERGKLPAEHGAAS
jgi:hypothetical protein